MIITSGGALIVYCSGAIDSNTVVASIYADNDYDAESKGVLLKGFYLASETNTMGVKYGTVVRREYSAA